MTEPYVLHERPVLVEPALVTVLAGWIDAGGAAQAAIAALVEQLDVRTIATFDDDTFIDYRARRPVMELRDGVNTGLVWPSIELFAGRDAGGHDLLLLTGHEPDAAWHRFVDATTELCVDLGTRMMVGLGAYPFATPHSRPSRLSLTTPSADLAARLPYLTNSVDVPAGVQAALEQGFAERGVPAVGLWAQVPHYVAALSYPPATAALLAGLAAVTGLDVETGELQEEARRHQDRLDELVSNNPEHLAVLRQLESAYDEGETQQGTGLAGPEAGRPPLTSGDLPTGDELAAELERYLREQGG